MVSSYSAENKIIEELDKFRGKIYSEKGGWVLGEGVYSHGYSMLDDLMGKVSFMQLLILHVTGKMPEERLSDWLEATFISLSWPDPRMWPNLIGALSSVAKTSPIAAVCLGTLASDSLIYGPGTFPATLEFLHKAVKHIRSGGSCASFVDTLGKGSDGFAVKAPGYIRPFAYGDERVASMKKIASKLGFKDGDYLTIAYGIEEVLYKRFGESLNLAGYMMAFLVDQGLSDRECCTLLSLCVNGGVHACYVEYLSREPDSFLPLKCEDIDYQGPSLRSL